MKAFLSKLWKDEEGTEVVEWIFVAVVLIAIAVAAYVTGLGTTIQDAINEISTAISTKANSINTP